MVTLEAIRRPDSAHLYPRELLTGCESALVLFAAGFHGAQDAVWIADAGLRATCVDTDAGRLAEMEGAYPTSWEFVVADAFEFAASAEWRWDVVSIDCPTNLFDRCAALLPLWCHVARRAVVLGCDKRLLKVPPGWQETERLQRSNFKGGVYWAVLERC